MSETFDVNHVPQKPVQIAVIWLLRKLQLTTVLVKHLKLKGHIFLYDFLDLCLELALYNLVVPFLTLFDPWKLMPW